MAQFDVYENPNSATRGEVPFLVDIQSDLLDPLATRVAIPLLKLAVAGKPLRYLNPVLELAGERYVLSTAELAGVPRRAFGARVGSVADQRHQIVRAVDFLLSGI